MKDLEYKIWEGNLSLTYQLHQNIIGYQLAKVHVDKVVASIVSSRTDGVLVWIEVLFLKI